MTSPSSPSSTQSTVVQNSGQYLDSGLVPEPPWALALIIVGLAWQRFREKRMRTRIYR